MSIDYPLIILGSRTNPTFDLKVISNYVALFKWHFMGYARVMIICVIRSGKFACLSFALSDLIAAGFLGRNSYIARK